VKAGADFVALGDWLWDTPDNVAATVTALARDLRLPETIA
jgi:hypothetical protein